jgi:anti-sigma B factor antagonist
MDLGTQPLLLSHAPVQVGERVVALRPRGELTRKAMGALTNGLQRLHRCGCLRVVIDVSEVTHLDYRSVPDLACQAEALRRSGGDVRLSGLSRYLDLIMRAGGAHHVFLAYGTLEAARASFGHPPAALLH